MPLFAAPVFLSGFAGLMYEVLWIKQLGQLFGNTAYASSATLGAFFAGLAAGGYYWGQKSKSVSNSLRLYAFLELGIAVSALLFFFLFKLYFLIYSPIFNLFGHRLFLFSNIKFLLSLVLLFLPCFFMGGTLPIIANAFVQHKNNLGKKASFLYAVNTLGAAIGAFTTSYFLLLQIGLKNSYLTAIGINAGVSLFAYIFSRYYPANGVKQSIQAESNVVDKTKTLLLNSKWILCFSFFSGFLTLCLEILWIRMFALVLHNSVYSFSAVLIVFILSLAVGSFIANRLCLLEVPVISVLSLLFILSGISAGLSPTIFNTITNGLDYTAPDAGWSKYIYTVFKNAVLVIMLPGVITGTVFPYLIKASQKAFKSNTGSIIGNLSCVNTIGAAIGSAVTGFFMLQALGLWKSVILVSLAYFIMAITTSLLLPKRKIFFYSAIALSAILLLTVFNPTKFPLVKIDEDEELLETWEGSYGSVAVVKGGENLSLVVDNYYTLGDLSDLKYERMQAHLPLLLHPNPEQVFFLGMGTGITAGTALLHPVSKVTTCELIPEVITAAQKYFKPYVFNLFKDSKSLVIAEDGRNFLLGSTSQYDVIISDLFTPWEAGTGGLYSIEHYQTVYSHLNKKGIFAQWLPLYQLSQREFNIIAKTMLKVFPQVTLWRGDLFSKDLIVALVGHKEVSPLNPEAVARRFKCLPRYKKESNDFTKAMLLIFYCGNLSENMNLFKDAQINTDNRPLIEYLSPITHRNQKAKKVSWFDSYELLQFYEKLMRQLSPEKDPFLKLFSVDDINAVRAGFSYYKGAVFEEDKKVKEAQKYYKEFFDYFPPELALKLEKKGFQYIGE